MPSISAQPGWLIFHRNAPSVTENTLSSGDRWTVYYLPGTTGWGPTFGGRPTAPWGLPNPVILNGSIGVQTNGFGFTVSWATNAFVVVEACAEPANSVWLPLSTNTLVNGSSYFADPEWEKSPGRFYRVRSA
jgi:hypothetical protein